MSEQLEERARELQGAAVNALMRGLDCLAEGRETLVLHGGRLREELMAALSAYQMFKHGELFEPGLVSSDPETRELAISLKVDCVFAAEAYRSHMARWSIEDARQRWTEYQPAARLVAGVLRRAIVDQLPRMLILCHQIQQSIRS